MKRIFKLSVYVAACVFVFFIIARETGKPEVLNENLSEQRVAIAFEWEKEVEVYFPKRADKECGVVYPLKRKIINAETLAPGALQSLLYGVTEEEEAQGYMTSIPSEVLIESFEVREGVAYIALSSNFDTALKNSCRKEAVTAQIEATLKSFGDIKQVVFE